MKTQESELEAHIRLKRWFYLMVHVLFVTGILYAFYHFINTPRSDMPVRRLWAYENWIIISFYTLFVYLVLSDREERIKKRELLTRFYRILRVNLLLLLLPWGLFLVLSPQELLVLLGLYSFYWRILGFCSLLGFLLYLFPYKFYAHKISYAILIFGIIDNFAAATIVLVLFFEKLVPLIALSAVPLLYYFSFFFAEQVGRYNMLKNASIEYTTAHQS